MKFKRLFYIGTLKMFRSNFKVVFLQFQKQYIFGTFSIEVLLREKIKTPQLNDKICIFQTQLSNILPFEMIKFCIKMVLASTFWHPSNLEQACEKFSEKNRKFEWNRNIRWFLLLNEMLSYMILDTATMKIDLFWENE